MSVELRDIYLPIVYITVIIGFQLCAYYIHLYRKYREGKLSINKILLGKGVIIGLASTGYILQAINSFYIADTVISEIFIKLMYLTLLLSVFFYLVLISGVQFRSIFNPRFTKFMAIFSAIPLLFMYLYSLDSFEFRFTVVFNIIGAAYLVIFQLKIIQLSTPNIRRRLVTILTGEFLSIGAIYSVGIILSLFPFDLFENIAQPIALVVNIAGILVAFLGLYDFPAFLEFDWKKNLLKLYIFDQDRQQRLYTFDFNEINNHNGYKIVPQKKYEEELFSAGLTGIDNIFAAITKTKSEKIEYIQHGSSYIFLEYGDKPVSSITYALLVNKELLSVKFLLRKLKQRFQEFYKALLIKLDRIEGHEKPLFSGFEIIIKEMLEQTV